MEIVLGLLATFFAIKWQSSAKENEKIRENIIKKKEELYNEFVVFFTEIFVKKKEYEQDKIISMFQGFTEKMILNASDDVILGYGDLFQSFKDMSNTETENLKNSFKLFGNLIIEMRKDLGSVSFFNKLEWSDIWRIWINDIDDLIEKPNKKGIQLLSNK